jgi:hypothetical protein
MFTDQCDLHDDPLKRMSVRLDHGFEVIRLQAFVVPLYRLPAGSLVRLTPNARSFRDRRVFLQLFVEVGGRQFAHLRSAITKPKVGPGQKPAPKTRPMGTGVA